MEPTRKRRRAADVLLAVYVAAGLAALVWPGYAWAGSRIEPLVLGLPFSLAWVAGWLVLTFVVVALYHWTRERSAR
jgi:TRAP-type C4-dicarboxylate transport system permease small subunit